MITAIIVEDSRLARLELKELLKIHPQIAIIGEAGSVHHALDVIRDTRPELIFLDIHLASASGFDLLEQLDHLPAIIFTTAFEEYALRSYAYNTIDYLLKPISPEHLDRAVSRLQTHIHVLSNHAAKSITTDRIFIKDQHKSWLVKLEDIRFFESKGNYVQVYFGENRPLWLRSLQQLEEMLNPDQFLRVNRQQMINKAHILKIEQLEGNRLKLILSCNEQIIVSRRQVAKVKEWFTLNNVP